ncbi:MAG: acyl-CoA dehydrogenase family protein [Bradymonadia bacterium]
MSGASTTDLSPFFAEHHSEIEARAQTFAEAYTVDEADDAMATRMAVQVLARAGLTAWAVPEAQGGAAFGRPEQIDVRAITLIRERLGWRDGLLDTAFAMQGLGSYSITLAGTEAQKETYLPGILSGDRIGAFALTEPDAGSDVASMQCVARREGDSYVLDGAKMFISNAGVATQYVVFATVDPSMGRKGITGFIVHPEDVGLTVDASMQVIAPHPIGTLHFEGCRIPASRRLGEEGQGFKLAMGTLDTFRISVAGAALGMARRALDEAVRWCRTRTQFGKPLGQHQIMGAYLADMATDFDAARMMVYRAAWLRDTADRRVSAEVAMGKLYATEAAQDIIDKAVQIHGGRGVMVGSAVERLYREIRALRIYEGTSEIQKLIIAGSLTR